MTDQVKMKEELKFVIKTFDGDMYILTGYKSAEEIDQKLAGLEKAEMPNGDIIKTSSIAKIQSFKSYSFQSKQKAKHRIGQYINGGGEWSDVQGGIGEMADMKSITGKIEAPGLPSPQHRALKNGDR